jgi:hypothetical protein
MILKARLHIVVVSVLLHGSLNAYQVKEIEPPTKKLTSLPADQCAWLGQEEAIPNNGTLVATLGLNFGRNEMGHLLDEAVAVNGRKECAKLGGNAVYLISEQHYSDTQDLSGVKLRCRSLAALPKVDREEVNKTVKEYLAESERSGNLVEDYRKEIAQTQFGKMFAAFSKSHPFNSGYADEKELRENLSLKSEPVTRLNGRPNRAYYDVKTGKAVGDKEYYDRQHGYAADLYVRFLRANQTLYQSEYPTLKAIRTKYYGKISGWAQWPYLPLPTSAMS